MSTWGFWNAVPIDPKVALTNCRDNLYSVSYSRWGGIPKLIEGLHVSDRERFIIFRFTPDVAECQVFLVRAQLHDIPSQAVDHTAYGMVDLEIWPDDIPHVIHPS